MSLTVHHLVKKYGSQVAVNNLSFCLKKGEITGFLGPNGAGKSTTMKIITGYLQPDAGEVTINALSVLKHPLECKKLIGYLPEANPLYVDMYTREYLNFLAGVHAVKQRKKRIEEVIQLVGLLPEAHKRIAQLSKGYKQRVGIAAALLHNPEVLVLDEPTSGLDPNQIAEIRHVIKTLSHNTTILFSTHIMQEVEALCDRVIIINKGSIVADDSLNNLRASVSSTIHLQLEEKVISTVFDGIGAQQVIPLNTEPCSVWRLITEDPDVTRKAIIQLSVVQQLNIISITSEEKSLENIFRSLTA